MRMLIRMVTASVSARGQGVKSCGNMVIGMFSGRSSCLTKINPVCSVLL